MKNLAIIGCGALGKILARNLSRAVPNSYYITCVMAKTKAHAQALADEIDCAATTDIEQLLDYSPDIVVEIASHEAVHQYSERILESGADLIIVSVGALAENDFKDHLMEVARAHNRKIYVANGAIGGFDLMQTVSLMGAEEVTINTYKEPESLNGAPYLKGQVLPQDHEEVIFEGDASEAIRGFPNNVNIAIATSLASRFPKTKVIIHSVPGLTENRHTIDLGCDHLHATISVRSFPNPEHPINSEATAFSVLAMLRNIASTIHYF
ncbi:MAG: DUF108 domain-containing protein [Burkholderiaceae bacterium]|jgi:aspartate dehydrogenase|nr:DUF108 domain-containing protein [Burkholderiaceae bacterium]